MISWAKRSSWVHIVIYAYIYCILLYMLALNLVVCYLYKTIVNIDIIGLNAIIE